jgi:asparagine synthase (glutamine-hydrolysing)
MSALAGIFNFNNEPLREEQREQLLILWNSLEERGPDGGDVVVKGPVGMSYRAFHTNRESRLERQPFIGANGEVIVGDLRLDNRDELIPKLRGLLRRGPGEITDIELVMAAYQRWGELFPLHLVGEFALMLYDPNNPKVLLARDHIGARPLYYHCDKDRLICSSELGPLLDVAGIPLEVNDEFIAGYLMYDPEPELTAYKNIHSVKPFHVMTFSCDGRMNEKRYWDLSSIKPIRYKNDAEYEDEFNFHFGNAVRGPLRTDRPVFSDLSGGLDSSSIVCVAHQAIQQGEVQAPELTTVSLVSSGSPSSDQRKYIRYVEEHIGQSGHYIEEDHYPLLSTLSVENALPTLNPLLFCEAKHRRLSRLMRDAKARVLLCGVGGDEITCSYSDPAPELTDLLVSLRLGKLRKRLRAWSRRQKKPYLTVLWQSVILSLLPRSFRLRNQLRKVPLSLTFLKDRFVKQMSLNERVCVSSPFDCNLPSAKDQALGFWTAVRGIAAGYRTEVTYGKISYPFLARPLVEYMQAIPHTQMVQPGESRLLMRRSLKDVLPVKIVNRRGKGNPEEVIARAFVREWPRLRPMLTNGRVGLRGYVDESSLVSALECYRLGVSAPVGILIKLLTLEVWLRGLENREAGNFRSIGARQGPCEMSARRTHPKVLSNGQEADFA